MADGLASLERGEPHSRSTPSCCSAGRTDSNGMIDFKEFIDRFWEGGACL